MNKHWQMMWLKYRIKHLQEPTKWQYKPLYTYSVNAVSKLLYIGQLKDEIDNYYTMLWTYNIECEIVGDKKVPTEIIRKVHGKLVDEKIKIDRRITFLKCSIYQMLAERLKERNK